MALLSRQDLMDVLIGGTILGTGGGGDLSEGVSFIDKAIAAGKSFELVSLDAVPDDALICTPYLLGAISELPAGEDALYEGLPTSASEPILLAYERLQAHLGQEFYGTVPCEMGGSNTAVAFFAAAMFGHKVVDADPAGRAVPEITHSTYFIEGLPAAPIMLANEFGEVMTLEHVHDDQRAETLVRALSIVSRNDIAAVDHALRAVELRGAIIPDTISKAMAFGRIYRQTQAAGEDVAAHIASAGGGRVVFRGRIDRCDWRTEAGFTLGSIDIAGSGDHSGDAYHVTLKNENMAAWLNGQVHATIPDLICLFDTQTGEPISNPHFRENQQVAVVILPAPAPFLTPRGLAAFGPRYAGIDADFVTPL